MNIKNISWASVTRYSQLVAIVLFLAVFVLGFELGKTYEYHAFINGITDGAGNTTSSKNERSESVV